MAIQCSGFHATPDHVARQQKALSRAVQLEPDPLRPASSVREASRSPPRVPAGRATDKTLVVGSIAPAPRRRREERGTRCVVVSEKGWGTRHEN